MAKVMAAIFSIRQSWPIKIQFSKIIYNNLHIGCPDPDYKGDTECDDQNNVESCEWDGGDCCGPNVNSNFCDECACKDPGYSEPTTTTTTTTTTTSG